MKIKVTVDVVHQVGGAFQSGKFEMLLPVGDRKASTDEAFKNHAKERLEQELKLVNVEVVRYEIHEQPLIEL
jgi:hypothetical protein